jgi:NAD(P)-dependent dehydrogenase (short-subunit alcohol dehydrogenase family)
MVRNPAFRNLAGARTREEASTAFVNANALPVPWVETSDVSNAVVWLASDDSRYVTGVALPVVAGSLQPFSIPNTVPDT